MQTQTTFYQSACTMHCQDFQLHHGDVIESLMLSYSVSGDLSDPIVVVLGGISASHAVVDNNGNKGWWNNFVGSQKAIDTDHLCVISLSYFSGAHDKGDDLLISTFDQARLLKCLLEKLSVKHVHAIIGCSYGGMVALAFCQLFDHMVDRLVCLCAAHKSSCKTIALRKIQREIVKLSKKSQEVKRGLVLARSLAMVGYRGETELEQRFNSTPAIVNGQVFFDINRYLTHNGRKFADNFLANQFMNLTRSIDLHCVDPSHIKTPSLLIAVNQDQMVPQQLINELHQHIPHSQLLKIDSDYGHDAFLLEKQQIAEAILPFINDI